MSKSITVRVLGEDREYLESFGSISDAIRELINLHRTAEPEGRLFNLIYLPDDPTMRELYCDYLRRFVPNAAARPPRDEINRKIQTKLLYTGYLVRDAESDGIRPTIRLKKTISRERFDTAFKEYRDFIKLNNDFPDIFPCLSKDSI